MQNCAFNWHSRGFTVNTGIMEDIFSLIYVTIIHQPGGLFISFSKFHCQSFLNQFLYLVLLVVVCFDNPLNMNMHLYTTSDFANMNIFLLNNLWNNGNSSAVIQQRVLVASPSSQDPVPHC